MARKKFSFVAPSMAGPLFPLVKFSEISVDESHRRMHFLPFPRSTADFPWRALSPGSPWPPSPHTGNSRACRHSSFLLLDDFQVLFHASFTSSPALFFSPLLRFPSDSRLLALSFSSFPRNRQLFPPRRARGRRTCPTCPSSASFSFSLLFRTTRIACDFGQKPFPVPDALLLSPKERLVPFPPRNIYL